MNQHELDLIADVIWFLKGYRAHAGDGCDINEDHMRALSEIRRKELDRINTQAGADK